MLKNMEKVPKILQTFLSMTNIDQRNKFVYFNSSVIFLSFLHSWLKLKIFVHDKTSNYPFCRLRVRKLSFHKTLSFVTVHLKLIKEKWK